MAGDVGRETRPGIGGPESAFSAVATNRQVIFWGATLAAVLVFLFVFRDILLPFVAGMVLAYALNPMADRLERFGLNRTAAAGLVVGLLALAVILAAVLLGPMLANQTSALITSLPAEAERMKGVIGSWAEARLGAHYPTAKAAVERGLSDVAGSLSGSMGGLLATLWTKSMALVSVVSILLITPLVVFYLLADWHKIVARVSSWLPRDHAPTINALARDIDGRTAAFLRGQGIICIVLGTFYAVGLTWAGLRYGAVVGLTTGVLAFIPVAGWALGLVTAMLLGVLQFGLDWVVLAKIAGVLAAGMAIDTALLSPKLVGERIGLHPVWLIFALFAMSALLGFVGTLVAVPLAAAIGVLVRHALGLYLASPVYAGTMKAAKDA